MAREPSRLAGSVSRRLALVVAALLVVGGFTDAWAVGPFALVAGRWEPAVVVVDVAAALLPENDGTDNAVVARVRVTPDVESTIDGVSAAPAAGLPSNVAIAADGRRAWVVNHAGHASAAAAAVSAHGHAGSLAALDVYAATDPVNDGSTFAIAAVRADVGVGPVGIALSADSSIALVSSSEGAGREDGGRVLSLVDLARGGSIERLTLALGDGGRLPQTSGHDCAALAADAARVPRSLPDPDVGCFPNVNGIALVERDGLYAFTANGGTDDVSVIDVDRARRAESDAEIARIPVGVGPWGIAASPDGRLVAVANRESAETGVEGNTVSVLDAARAIAGDVRAEIATIVVGTDDPAESTRPFGLAFTPDGSAIVVANFRNDTVSVVDVGRVRDRRADAEVARIALRTPTGAPARPRGVALTPDGRYAVVSGGARDTARGGWLFIVDLRAAALAATVTDVGNEPYGLAIAAGL